jgi:hypothetical protein
MEKDQNRETIKRIPYDVWASSQLSVAKYYGGININGKHYLLDYDNCPKKIINGKEKYFPDLILESEIKKPKKQKINKDAFIKTLQDFGQGTLDDLPEVLEWLKK